MIDEVLNEKIVKEAELEVKRDEKIIQPEKQKKDTMLYWSLAFLLAIVILFFAAGKYFGDKEPENPTLEYNNWQFTKIAGLWWFEWQKGTIIYQVPLRFNPLEVEGIPIIGNLDIEKFNAKDYVYLTFDFSNETNQNFTTLALAAGELSQNMATAIQKIPIAACVNNQSDTCFERPIKTCENTEDPVIYLREGGNSLITLKGSCIILTGENLEIVRTVDRLLYHWYGIIKQ